MLTVKSILDAGAALAEEVWPGGKVYINVVPVNFVRPSCLVEVTGLTSEPESRRTAARTANLRITRFQRVDDRHSVQVEVLAEELALKDLGEPTHENYNDILERMEEYMGEFEENGTDHVTVELE